MKNHEKPIISHHVFQPVLRDVICPPDASYAYIPIGKAANTAVKRFISSLEGVDLDENDYFSVHYTHRDEDTSRRDHLNIIPRSATIADFSEILNQRKVVAAVRNPYSRLLSAYLDKIMKNRNNQARLMGSFGVPFGVHSFDDFARHVVDTPDDFVNIHWVSQNAILGNFLPLSVVGSFEYIDEFLRYIHDNFYRGKDAVYPNPSEPPHRTGAGQKMLEYYTEELADLVYARYKADFDRFGYSRDLTELAPRESLSIVNMQPTVEQWAVEGCQNFIGGRSVPNFSDPADGRLIYTLHEQALTAGSQCQSLYYALSFSRLGDLQLARQHLANALLGEFVFDRQFTISVLNLLKVHAGLRTEAGFSFVRKVQGHWSKDDRLMALCKIVMFQSNGVGKIP